MEDVPLLLLNTYEQNETTKKFRILASFIVVEIILVVLFTILCFALPDIDHRKNDYFILAYTHIAFWGLAMILERILRRNHKKLRLLGYFIVHKKTRKFNKTLGLILSAGNLVLLTLSTVYQNVCTKTPCSHFMLFNFELKPINYLQVIVVLELLVAVPLLSMYLAIVIKLIRTHALPDILEEERRFLHPTRRDGLLMGRRPDCDPVQEVMERQANFIQCLQERSLFLSAEIQRLRNTSSTA